ncbi:hypothetical protein ACFL35_21495, partial [Candidatus Riflebacteria bacterium]
MIKKFLHNTNFLFQILLLASIFALLEGLSYRNNKIWDHSHDGRYTLSASTISLLSSLKKDLKIFVFIKNESRKISLVAQMLALFKEHCPRLSFDFKDLDRHPGLAQKYKVESYGIIILDYGEKVKRVDRFDEETLATAILELATAKK